MNEITKEWITALRSGKYKQGHLRLARRVNLLEKEAEFEYCCLGVLCEIVGKSKSYNPITVSYQYDESSTGISETLREKVGLSTGDVNHLMHLNDYERVDFNKIADWIETNC